VIPLRLQVKVVPGASRDGIAGWLGDSLKVRVKAPAERGKANAAVVRLLAETLEIPADRLRIVAGGSSPRKVVEIDGLSDAEAGRRLGRLRTSLPVRKPPAALRIFLAPYDPSVQKLFQSARRLVLGAAPEANELIYDAYNAVSAAYSFSERLQEAFCHVAVYASHVNLGFNHGAALPDADGILVGSGARIRHVEIHELADLRRPAIAVLVRAAAEERRARVDAVPSHPVSIVKPTSGKKRRPGGR